MKYLYQVFGLSKQGYYQRIKRGKKLSNRNETILSMVREVRKTHPRAGTRKLLVSCSLSDETTPPLAPNRPLGAGIVLLHFNNFIFLFSTNERICVMATLFSCTSRSCCDSSCLMSKALILSIFDNTTSCSNVA